VARFFCLWVCYKSVSSTTGLRGYFNCGTGVWTSGLGHALNKGVVRSRGIAETQLLFFFCGEPKAIPVYALDILIMRQAPKGRN
jgi:hypothetical protein